MKQMLIRPNTKVIPVSYVLTFLDFVESQGVNPQRLLASAKVSPQYLNDPESFLSFFQFKRISEVAIDATDDPNLALYFGRQLNFAAHGELGYAALTSANIEEAILLGLKYFKIRFPLLKVKFYKDQHNAKIEFDIALLKGKLYKFAVDTVTASLHRMREIYLGEKKLQCEATFKYCAPSDQTVYHEVFGAQVAFDKAFNAVYFPVDDLQKTNPMANSIARKIAEKKCQQKLKELESHDDIVSQVQSILLSQTGYFPSLEVVAEKLCMSPRTLRRRLKDFDCSYQEVLDKTRKELATHYLQTTDLPLIDIANLLNFSDSSNFSSAFKKWTGMTPNGYRKQ